MRRTVLLVLPLLACGPQTSDACRISADCGDGFICELELGEATGTCAPHDDSEPPDFGKPGATLTTNRDVDILLVVDNSGSMGEEQGNLASNLASFIDVLEAPALRANYRIGITTTDNGNPWCQTTPLGGKLRATACTQRLEEFTFDGTDPPTVLESACTDACALADIPLRPTTTDDDANAVPRPWLERIEAVTNLPDGVSTLEALQCFAPQGINGCGFESHLESMYKSVLRMGDANEASFGFRRDTAIFAVVFLTDEVDCSSQNEFSEIFTDNKVFWSDPLAMFPTSAVCWNAGVECLGGPGTYDECTAVNKNVSGGVDTADENAVLHPVDRYINQLQNIENDKQSWNPNQEVLVSVVAGVPVGYPETPIVYSDAADPTFQDLYGTGPGCTSANGQAVPPVRLREFAGRFETDAQANLYSVCADSYAGALGGIADAIAAQVKPACFPGCVADGDPSTELLDPSCKVTERIPTENGLVTEDVPACAYACGGTPCELADGPDAWDFPTADDRACFRMLVDDGATPTTLDNMSPQCLDDGWNLEFLIERRPGFPATPGTYLEGSCVLTDDLAVDCPDL